MTIILIISGINLFVWGALASYWWTNIRTSPLPTTPIPSAPVPEPRKMDMEALETEKKRLVAANAAFEQLMSYTPEIAYKNVPKRGEI